MGELDRRRFLIAAAATVTVMGISWQSTGTPQAKSAGNAGPEPTPSPAGPGPAGLLPPPSPGSRVALPDGGVLSRLPGEGDLLAWTVDDGVDTDVVRLYTQFAKDTGVRLTYFVNGIYRSWTDNAALLRPLVDSGQIQLANHTWSHPDLTKVTKSRIVDEFTRNDRFLRDTYGVDAAPYFRPPYGNHNAAVDEVAADLGYRMPTLWCGTLADSSVISEDYVLTMADQFFTAQNIVIGHLNHEPITHVYGQLVEVIRSRALRTVTLNDVFLRPGSAHPTSRSVS